MFSTKYVSKNNLYTIILILMWIIWFHKKEEFRIFISLRININFAAWIYHIMPIYTDKLMNWQSSIWSNSYSFAKFHIHISQTFRVQSQRPKQRSYMILVYFGSDQHIYNTFFLYLLDRFWTSVLHSPLATTAVIS